MSIYLCSGLGGQVLDDETVRIDVDRSVKPTIQADVRFLPLRPDIRPGTLLMTPPCTYLSKAWQPWPRKGIRWNLDVVGACLEAIPYLKPKKWVLENPQGYLRRLIGEPQGEARWAADDLMKKDEDFWTNDARALRRAIMPKEITQRLLER